MVSTYFTHCMYVYYFCIEVVAASYGIMYNMAFSDLRVDPSSKGIVSKKVSCVLLFILWDNYVEINTALQ